MVNELIEILLQLILDGSTEVIENPKFSKRIRFVMSVLITLIFIVFLGFLIWVFMTNNSLLVRGINVGLVIFLVGYLISLWRKVLS